MKSQIELSLVMIVKNEERTLARCLESVKDLVDEMIIVDTGSTDKTIDIATSYGAKLFYFDWVGDFSVARNFALSKANGEWRLVLDADEWVIEGNKEELKAYLKEPCLGVIEQDNAFNKNGELQYNKTFMGRILPKDAQYVGKVHEQVMGFKYKRMPIRIEHDGYLYQDKSDRNLEILFKTCKENPNDAYIQFQLAHTLYLAGRGQEALPHYAVFYKNCEENLEYRASAIVDYLYCVTETKQFEQGLILLEKEKKHYMDYPDFYLVSASFYRELVLSDVKKYIHYLPKIEEEYLSCLELGETNKYDSIMGAGSFLAAYNLGVWYEVTKQIDKALICYNMAAEWGYQKAKKRIQALQP